MRIIHGSHKLTLFFGSYVTAFNWGPGTFALRFGSSGLGRLVSRHWSGVERWREDDAA